MDRWQSYVKTDTSQKDIICKIYASWVQWQAVQICFTTCKGYVEYVKLIVKYVKLKRDTEDKE